MTHTRGGMPRESPHMHLVDDKVLDREIDRAVVTPVEILVRHPRPVGVDFPLLWGA